MTAEERNQELLELTVRGLEDRATGDDVADALRAARRAAIASAEAARADPAVPAPLANWIPAGAMAATLLAVGVIAMQVGAPRLPPLTERLHEEMFAAQHLELLEDLELYAWMVELEETTSSPEGAG